MSESRYRLEAKMTRDWKLLGTLLQQIEDGNIGPYISNLESDEDREKAILHMELLQDAGYIKGFQLRSARKGHPMWTENSNDPIRITMSGYDFKEVVNDKKLFSQIVDKANDAGVKLSWEFIKAVIPIVIKGLIS